MYSKIEHIFLSGHKTFQRCASFGYILFDISLFFAPKTGHKISKIGRKLYLLFIIFPYAHYLQIWALVCAIEIGHQFSNLGSKFHLLSTGFFLTEIVWFVNKSIILCARILAQIVKSGHKMSSFVFYFIWCKRIICELKHHFVLFKLGTNLQKWAQNFFFCLYFNWREGIICALNLYLVLLELGTNCLK